MVILSGRDIFIKSMLCNVISNICDFWNFIKNFGYHKKFFINKTLKIFYRIWKQIISVKLVILYKCFFFQDESIGGVMVLVWKMEQVSQVQIMTKVVCVYSISMPLRKAWIYLFSFYG